MGIHGDMEFASREPGRSAPTPDEPVPMLRFVVGLVRAAAALAAFVLDVARAELPDPIDLQPQVLHGV